MTMSDDKRTEREPKKLPGPVQAEDARRAAAETVLLHLREGETMEAAALAAGMSHDTLQRWRKADPPFDAAVGQARAAGRAARAEVIARALYAAAEKVATDPRYTTAAIFALKNLDPVHWRDSHEISGPGGGAIPIQVVLFGVPAGQESLQEAPDELERLAHATDDDVHPGAVVAAEPTPKA